MKFASIAIVAGYLVRLFKENFECLACLSIVETTSSNEPILQLIANQDRGGLTYPKPKFVYLISVLLDFMEQIVPLLNSNGIVKTIYEFVYPKLLKCPLWDCNINQHKVNMCSLICAKFLPLILKNMAKNATNETHSSVNKNSLTRKYIKFT